MIKDKKVYAIIGAAGSGKRMAAPLPKQFIKIGGKTILEMTAEKFLDSPLVDKLFIVIAEDYMDHCTELFSEYIKGKRISLVQGGDERQDSVFSALKSIVAESADADSLVLIHDGVRPYVTADLIERVAEAAYRDGAALPAVPPKDTIRHLSEGTLDRSRLCCVQTPQGFRLSLLIEAFEKAYADNFYGTDDAGLVERLGKEVTIVEGDSANIKITTPEDLTMESRIGTGYDVHRLTEGRKLILGGIEIPYEKGLLGHSDADVLVHALMDAMLGAAALGDIGKLFPDSDQRYSGISSMILLEEVGRVIAEKGYSLGNADITVICQKPKLAGYIDEMRCNIAKTLKVPDEKISIKATTTEKLGFEGRGEGIAAQAVCILNGFF